jgi:Chaperone of endosialidase
MKSLVQLKKTIAPCVAALVLTWFGLAPSPEAFGVVPAPDGGYPGGNTAEGQNALFRVTTGTFNTAVGFSSLWSDTTGQYNTALGAGTLLLNTAFSDTATGAAALLNNTAGFANTANGAFALLSNSEGHFNTAVGTSALRNNTTGSSNTAVGDIALFNNTTGEGNTVLGANAGGNIVTADNVICIGPGVGAGDVSNTCFIGNIRGVTTQFADAIPVFIDSHHQLGTMSSSKRFKTEIRPMNQASEAILVLKPVTFQYKSDKTGTTQFGLIAEQVAKVNPDLVVRDADGNPYTVRYDAVNAMLLNEFLKEHSKVEKLEATVAKQHKDFEAALADLKGQIQKVSAQLELNKPTPQTVVNNR